jgi:DNA topoisomerase I
LMTATSWQSLQESQPFRLSKAEEALVLSTLLKLESLTGGEWRTFNGQHVYIKDGVAQTGRLKGQKIASGKTSESPRQKDYEHLKALPLSYGSEFSRDYWERFTVNEVEALRSYSRSSYAAVNDCARDISDCTPTGKRIGAKIDSVAAKVPEIPADMKVFRAFRLPEAVAAKLQEEFHAGKETIFQDKGFSSTTTDGNVANRFARSSDPSSGKREFIAAILLPKGAHAIDMEKGGLSRSVGEHEFLLPRGAQFRIVNWSKTSLRDYVHLVYEPPKMKKGERVLIEADKTLALETSADKFASVPDVIIEDNEITKAYNPDQPRDEKGRWGEGSGDVPSHAEQEKAVDGIKEYLGLVAQVQDQAQFKGAVSPAGFMLAHGQPYYADAKSFAGARGTPHQCYKNAYEAAVDNPKLTYVEGHVSVQGVPLEHAWTVDEHGNVRDPTIRPTKGLGYFGIPFKTDYLMKATLSNRVYGLMGYQSKSYPQLLKSDPSVFRASDKLQKAFEELEGGEWRTFNGRHVYIKDDMMMTGPMKGQKVGVTGASLRRNEFRQLKAAKLPDVKPDFTYAKVLSSAEVDAITRYTGASYKEINCCQRETCSCTEKAVKLASNIDTAFDKVSPQSQDTKVYRGFALPTPTARAILDAINDGKEVTFTDKGFASASASQHVAQDFSIGSTRFIEKVHFVSEVLVPKGSRYLNIDKANLAGRDEKELLLPRNSTFKIISAERTAHDVYLKMVYAPSKMQKVMRQLIPADSELAKSLEDQKFVSVPDVIIEDAPEGLHKAFDPDEERDDRGRWTSGATGETKIQDGKRVQHDGSPLPEHIEKLSVPPAWKDVRFNPDPKGDLLAIGKDEKGRRQAIYSKEFSDRNAAAKFERIMDLDQKYSAIKEANDKFRNSDDPKERDKGDILHTVMTLGIRPGSEDDTGAKKQAYGATTLLGEHVKTDEDGKVSLQYVGKSGKDLNIPVEDKATASMLQDRAKVAGDKGQIFPSVNDRVLLEHVHELTHDEFKTKDFRTLLGTRTARDEVASRPAPTNAKEYQKAVMGVAKAVSTKLGNTPSVALQSYIHPGVFAEWRMSSGA